MWSSGADAKGVGVLPTTCWTPCCGRMTVIAGHGEGVMAREGARVIIFEVAAHTFCREPGEHRGGASVASAAWL